jgi:hypothetical protein
MHNIKQKLKKLNHWISSTMAKLMHDEIKNAIIIKCALVQIS